MSNSLATRTFFEGLAAAAVAAWSVTRVYPGAPREPMTASKLPYSSIDWSGAAITFSASGRKNSVEQTYEFEIYGAFAFPDDPQKIILLEASDRADELIAAVQTGPNFTAYGYLPLVTAVEPMAIFDEGEEAYGVKVTFSVKATADHS